LAKIYFATEGWIGGLILLAESLSRLPKPSRAKHISEELPPTFKNEVFQYFAKEIFSSQPKRVQEFLLQSSILEVLDPGFMEDLTGAGNSEEVLRELVRRNLFVQSIFGERKGWLFRYHQLFRDFLKIRFESVIKDEERRSLFSKAGELYEKRGEFENAVKCFLEAKAYPQAGSVIERLGMSLLRRDRKKDLHQWILALPEGIIQENPWLLFYLAMTGRFMGGREDVAARYKVYTLLKEKGDQKGHLVSLARLIEASIYTGVHLVSVGRLIEEGEAILQRWQMDECLYERALLWYYLGLGHILGDGEIRKGILACQNAHLIAKRVKDINLQASALNFSTLGYALVGEFSLADEIWKKLEGIVQKGVSPELRVLNLMVACCLANLQGDFVRGRDLLEKLQNEIGKYGFISLAPWICEISGYLSFCQGEISKAEEVAKQYLSLSRTLKNDFLKALALRLLGLIYLSQGEFREAKEATDQSLEALRKEAHSECEFQKVKVLLGLICYHLKKYQVAEKKLEEALKYFEAISSYNSAAEAHFVIALLKWNQGKKDGAVSHLQMGFKIAEEKRYDYFFFLGLKYLTKVCLLALELKVAGAMDYAAHLLSTRLSSGAEEELKKFSHHPDSQVREKAWGIRRMIHRSKVPLLAIKTLGEFRIFRGDSPIEEEEWDRNQPKKLLKAILSHSAPRVPKEILMEDLWPEERPHKSENNFKLTLLRLRRSLEPGFSKEFNSNYIHLHDDFVFLDPELCQVDAHVFLSLLKNGEEKENKGDIQGALSSYAEAMKIYKGDFLPEEVYTPWVDLKREKLRRKYIE
jgi:tetratricopeptide (TPR) repeat protein